MVSVKILIKFLTRFNKNRGYTMTQKSQKNIEISSQLFRRSLLVSAIVSALGVTFVQAQQAQQQGRLETITFTAQKRAQNLQKVPVSVNAFTGDELAVAVIKDMYDL
jgi:outer membrane receptor protein involved in Fe transport